LYHNHIHSDADGSQLTSASRYQHDIELLNTCTARWCST